MTADREELSKRLLALFVEELEEHVGAMNDDLLALETEPGDAERLKSIFRTAHTLKGAARAAGVPEVETACHAMEDLLAAAREGRPLDPPTIQLLFGAADALQEAAALVREGSSLNRSAVAELPGRIARYRSQAGGGVSAGGASRPSAGATGTAVTGAPTGGRTMAGAASTGGPARPSAAEPVEAARPGAGVDEGRADVRDTARPGGPGQAAGSVPPLTTSPAAQREAAPGTAAAPDPGADPAPLAGAETGRDAEAHPASEEARSPAARAEAAEPRAEDTPAEVARRAAARESTVRVGSERLDQLLASVAEVQALGRRAEMRTRELLEVEELVNASLRALNRATRSSGNGGQGPIRSDGADSLQEQLQQTGDRIRRLVREAAADGRSLTRTSDDLVEQIRQLRMRPVAEAFEGLQRTVRDLAANDGKDVRLVVDGGDVRIDRAVLDGLREAVLPAVRNAIDHGLEPPADRESAGKPAQGTIRISAGLEGDRVWVNIEDDGRGVDAAALRRRIGDLGQEVPRTDAELAAAILSGGVSSRSVATAISGRGVGLDIVRAAMERVRGRVTLDWTQGQGTRVRLEFPPSLASLRMLLVSTGPQILGIPTLAVERLLRVSTATLKAVDGRLVLPLGDGPIPVVSLARLLGPPLVSRPAAETEKVVVLSSGGHRLGIVVDELLSEDELVVRPVHAGAQQLRFVSGAATLATGAVAPLLDAAALMAAATSAVAAPAAAEREAPRRSRVLIADDSLTTRTLEQSLLQAAGYDVRTAADGLDAWRLLQEEPFDLLVSDVEMPRMDGFRLCETVRASARFQNLPVVLVTARESAEDRARGLEAGADAYLPKSSFDQEDLLNAVRRLLDA